MKRLKVGAVNSISFIRNIQYTINSFDVTFEKVVGGAELTLSGLTDQLNLDSCSDFIVLNLDLISNSLEGGEYYLTISNEGSSSTYLCEVENYQYNTHGTDIYADSVVLSNDLTSSSPVENTDGSAAEDTTNEVVLFFAPDLTTAQSMYVAGTHSDALDSSVNPVAQLGYNIDEKRFTNYDSNGDSTTSYSLTDFQNDNLRVYAVSSRTDTYYFSSLFRYLEGTTNNAIPFATGYYDTPYHTEVSIAANTVTELKDFGSGAMLPSLQGIGTAPRVMFDFGITRAEFVDNITAIRTINGTFPQGGGFADTPEWKDSLGQTISRMLVIVDNNL